MPEESHATANIGHPPIIPQQRHIAPSPPSKFGTVRLANVWASGCVGVCTEESMDVEAAKLMLAMRPVTMSVSTGMRVDKPDDCLVGNTPMEINCVAH